MNANLDRRAKTIRIQLLAQFKVERSDGLLSDIAIKSKKGRALLAYLTFHLGKSLPRARLAALLWPDQPERVGRQSLRQILTELRDEIGPEFDQGISKEEIQLNPRLFEVDAAKFVECSKRPNDFEKAVSLYEGDLTSDLDIRANEFDDWLALERRKLHSLALEVFDAHARALDAHGKKEKALVVAERLLGLDPLRETTHRLIIALEAAVNGRGSALARADTFTKALSRQLGVSPEPETIALIAALANSSPGTQSPIRFESPASRILPALPQRRVRQYLGATAAVAILVAALGWNFGVPNSESNGALQKSAKTKTLPGMAYSIAVIPFSARTESDQVKRFTNSLEEDVIDTLSRAPRFLVISRQTSRSYRDTNKDAREIGKELNVDFLLSGNVDVDGEKLFIRAQLIDAQSGQLIWSDRFMHSKEVTYSVFEEIVLAVSRQLHIQIVFTEANKRIKAERQNPDYGDLIQRGWAESFRSFAKHENADHALKLFEDAAALDPNRATARIGIASILIRRIAELRSPDRAGDLERAETLLKDVLKDHSDNATAHYFLGIAHKLRGRNADSIAEFEKSLKLNPSNANAHAQLGHSLVFLGRAHEADPHIQKAIRLSPQDPTISSWFLFAGQAQLHLRNYEKAIYWIERSVANYPRSARTQIFLAAAYMLKGDREAATIAARRALKELPHLEAEYLNNTPGDATPAYLAERARILDAMREALKLAREM
jgi:TolB-like protein/DNA-binding SARP family transcriptional activator/Tfp pilus assembly protein PilF